MKKNKGIKSNWGCNGTNGYIGQQNIEDNKVGATLSHCIDTGAHWKEYLLICNHFWVLQHFSSSPNKFWP